MGSPDDIFIAGERIAEILQDQGLNVVVIGAIAMASHRHIRFTEDLDLGVSTQIQSLRTIQAALENQGFETNLRMPASNDPLGGVIDVQGEFGLIQIVNFGERFPRVIEESISAAEISLSDTGLLKIPPLGQLIAMKLYAGGIKSAADIVALLVRNPEADTAAIRQLCKSYRLNGFDPLVAEAEAELAQRQGK